jgi:hypothetical protein
MACTVHRAAHSCIPKEKKTRALLYVVYSCVSLERERERERGRVIGPGETDSDQPYIYTSLHRPSLRSHVPPHTSHRPHNIPQLTIHLPTNNPHASHPQQINSLINSPFLLLFPRRFRVAGALPANSPSSRSPADPAARHRDKALSVS